MLKLDACTSAAQCLDLLAQDAARASGGWVLAVGARVESWTDRRWPTRAELDRVCPRPCCVMSFDHHAVAANTAAMRAGGLSETAPDPPGGVICRDQHAQPTGLLLESAAYQVWHAAPEPTPAERREHVLAALNDLSRHGFLEVHDLLSPSWLGPMLAELEATGQLSAAVRLYAPLAEIHAQHEASKQWGSPRIRLAGAKMFADGTLNSKTAWMLHPYADPLPGLPTGKVMSMPDQIAAAREHTLNLGLGLAVHAIGDAAVRAVLDVENQIQSRGCRPSAECELRIEHCELIDRADVPRFADLGVIASVQPCHLLADIEVLRRQLPHRLDRVLPLRDLIDAGCVAGRSLIFGSDTPIVRPDPQDNIQAAVHRRRAGADKSESIAPDQMITEKAAWACFAGSVEPAWPPKLV
jgi:predicted amidohydrolase YtcJ